jgi:hypothetical protein
MESGLILVPCRHMALERSDPPYRRRKNPTRLRIGNRIRAPQDLCPRATAFRIGSKGSRHVRIFCFGTCSVNSLLQKFLKSLKSIVPQLSQLSNGELFAPQNAGLLYHPPDVLKAMTYTSRSGWPKNCLCPFVFAGALGLVSLLSGCQTTSVKQPTWRETVKQQLPVLGHRNWIVIADSAYPAQVSPGVHTIYTGASQLEVVKSVLAELDAVGHVRPVIYLDLELEQVPESLAPGIEAYRQELKVLLAKRRVSTVPHEELIAKLDQAGHTFKVLLLKTDLALPYTSVFMELDCGYWGPEPEKKLRELMADLR